MFRSTGTSLANIANGFNGNAKLVSPLPIHQPAMNQSHQKIQLPSDIHKIHRDSEIIAGNL